MSKEECVCNICSNTFDDLLLISNNDKKHNYNLRSKNNLNNTNINNVNNLGHKVKLKCGHLFHYWCIKQWYIKIKNNKCRIGMGRYNERQCPYCRLDGGYLVKPNYDNDYVIGINIKDM